MRMLVYMHIYYPEVKNFADILVRWSKGQSDLDMKVTHRPLGEEKRMGKLLARVVSEQSAT